MYSFFIVLSSKLSLSSYTMWYKYNFLDTLIKYMTLYSSQTWLSYRGWLNKTLDDNHFSSSGNICFVSLDGNGVSTTGEWYASVDSVRVIRVCVISTDIGCKFLSSWRRVSQCEFIWLFEAGNGFSTDTPRLIRRIMVENTTPYVIWS